jgi:hypothetical protein
MPPHTLHLYQKPAIGSGFIKRYQVFNYRHKIASVGWFDTASCDLVVTRAQAERWLDQNIGNRVAFYVDNPVEPIWEGLVSRVTYQVANITFTASLDQLKNRVVVQSANVTTAATTTAVDNTDSQAIYGIKEGVIDANIQYTGTGSQVPDNLRDHIITATAWPQISTAFGGGNAIVLSVEFVGFYHTLEWEKWAFATNSAVDASVAIDDVIENLANATTFLDNADRTLIETNAAFDQNKLSRNGQSAWQFMQAIQEAGDGSSTAWVMGVTPTGYGGVNTRRFYYRPANSDVEYTVRLGEGMRVRNLYGNIIKPWRVVPDRGVRLLDVLTGWSGIGDDPRESYLEVIDYDAETQSVAWQTSDNIELEGAFQLRRYFKAHSTRFGANVRPVG